MSGGSTSSTVTDPAASPAWSRRRSAAASWRAAAAGLRRRPGRHGRPVCWCSTAASTWSAAAPRRRTGCWSAARAAGAGHHPGARSGCPASWSGRCRRWRCRQPVARPSRARGRRLPPQPAVVRARRQRAARLRADRGQRAASSRGSAAGSTGCRWRSSSPPPGCGCSRWKRSPTPSTGSRCSAGPRPSSPRPAPDPARDAGLELSAAARTRAGAARRTVGVPGRLHPRAVTAVREPARGARPTLDLVSRLIDRSLVSVADRGRPTRYRLLETVRALRGRRPGAQPGGRPGSRTGTSSYFVALAERAEPHLTGADAAGVAGRLDAEVAQLRRRPCAGRSAAARAGGGTATGLGAVALLVPPRPLQRRSAVVGRSARGGCRTRRQRSGPGARRGRPARVPAVRLPRPRRAPGDARQIFDGACRTRSAWPRSCSRSAAWPASRGTTPQPAPAPDSEQRWRAAGNADGVARSANYLGFVAWLEGDP